MSALEKTALISDHIACSLFQKHFLIIFLHFFLNFRSSKKKFKTTLYVAIVFIAILLGIIIALAVLYVQKDSNSEPVSRPIIRYSTTPTVTSTSARSCSQPTGSPPKPASNTDGPYDKAAVAADDLRCSKIGVRILRKNGSAVDAAIASLFCLGVINMHSTGIGGGGVMVVYSKENKTAEYFNFRETAPGKATENMYVNKSTSSKIGKSVLCKLA